MKRNTFKRRKLKKKNISFNRGGQGYADVLSYKKAGGGPPKPRRRRRRRRSQSQDLRQEVKPAAKAWFPVEDPAEDPEPPAASAVAAAAAATTSNVSQATPAEAPAKTEAEPPAAEPAEKRGPPPLEERLRYSRFPYLNDVQMQKLREKYPTKNDHEILVTVGVGAPRQNAQNARDKPPMPPAPPAPPPAGEAELAAKLKEA